MRVEVRFCSAKSAASKAMLPLQFWQAHFTVIRNSFPVTPTAGHDIQRKYYSHTGKNSTFRMALDGNSRYGFAGGRLAD